LLVKLRKSVHGILERAAFRKRERERYSRRTPLRLASQAQLIEDDIKHHADVEGVAVVDDGFIERMASARDKVAATAAKYSYAGYAVTAYFLLAILSVDIEISAFGVTLKRVAGLNELLLIGSAITGALAIWHRVRVISLDAAIKAAIDLRHEGPIRYTYGAAFLPSQHVNMFNPNYSPHLVWSPWKQRFVMGTSIIALLFIFSALFASMGFRIYAAYWVWSTPSTPNGLLRIAILIAPVVDMAALAYGMMYFLPLPHRDYFLDNQAVALRERYPEAADTLLSELYDEGIRDRIALEEAGHMPPRNVKGPT
jgi:hypothetical protein